MFSQSKKKRNIPSNFNTNYRKEMKLVQINMDYCLLSFDAFKFSLGGRLHGRSLPNFNFFQCKPSKFDNEILKFTAHIARIQVFTTFLTTV